jgi:hypothetical protein
MLSWWSGLKPWQRGTLTVIGSLIVGVIGNGLWARLFDPLYVKARDGLLNVATLGLQSLKDSLYAEVALGFHEHASNSMLADWTYWYCLAYVALYIYLGILKKGFEVKLESLQKDDWLAKDERTLDERYKALQERTKALVISGQRLQKRFRLVRMVVLPLIVFVIAINIFSVARAMYTTAAVTYYHQLINLDGPFLSPVDITMYHSRFAQIRSAQDYTDITNELRQIATTHQLKLPSFTAW